MASRRTWPQRLTIVAAVLGSIGSFSAAGALYVGQQVLEDRNLVEIASPDDPAFAVEEAPGGAVVVGGTGPDVPAPTGPPETFRRAEPAAKNFLVTGADNNSCIDPDSPFAGAFGDRTNFGERSDTIMVWRVNPATSQVAVLSFPRDLWVSIAGRSGKNRINAAYSRDDPQRLIDTIDDNFGIQVDHFVQVDFCAFKVLVDAAGGVGVPFEYPVRDTNTGLYVPEPGCFTFTGEHALAYVRSRKLDQYIDDDWVRDGTSDLGRISRQQDFLRRVVASLLARGAYRPEVVRGLIETSDDFLTYDSQLTPAKMLEFAGVLRGVQPANITTYQIEAVGRTINGNSVLEPRTGGENMQSILAVFQGRATLAQAPDQVFEDVTTTTLFAPDTTAPEASDATAPTTAEAVPFETLPEVVAEENTQGVVPDANVTCP